MSEINKASKRKLRSLEDTLFEAFANLPRQYNQEEQQMWAIREGIRRTELSHEWREVKARKIHECMRGCKIEQGDTYFGMTVDAGWGYDSKICPGCMAMILYFKEVQHLPPKIYSHWDIDSKKPVLIESPEVRNSKADPAPINKEVNEMAQKGQQKKLIPRPEDYQKFKGSIEKILKQAEQPLTWAEIKEKAGFEQKVPNNKWVKWMEEDIGLVREKTKDGKTVWRLKTK